MYKGIGPNGLGSPNKMGCKSPMKQTRIGRRGPDGAVSTASGRSRGNGKGMGDVKGDLMRNTKQPMVELKPKKASIPLEGKEAKLKK